MGTYGVSNQELYEVINDALDNIQGDFTRKQLKTICAEIANDYEYVSDVENKKSRQPDKG